MGAGKASPPEDFAEPESKLFELPRPGANGKVLSVLIRTVPAIDLITAMEGVPSLNRAASAETGAAPAGEVTRTFEQMRQILLEQEQPQRKIVALGVVSPVFSFEKEVPAGQAPWRNLHTENQQALIAEILDFSGFSEKPKPDVPVAPATPAEAAVASAEAFRGVAAE